MKNHVIIGIVGKKFSGKSTIGEILENEHKFTPVAFADPLKMALQIAMCIPDKYLRDPKFKNEKIPHWNITSRTLMQIFGTEIMQIDLVKRLTEANENPWWGRQIWVERFRIWHNMHIAERSESKVVITDVRFQHEVDTISEMGGTIWKVIRPTTEISNDQHASEKEMDALQCTFHETFHNDSSIQNLKTKVQDATLRII